MARDIFDRITTDHEIVRNIFERMSRTSRKAIKRREALLEQLRKALLPVFYAQEQYFYQALLDDAGESSNQELVYRALEEHRAAKAVLADLEELSEDDPRWSARLGVLADILDRHTDFEVDEIFAFAREIMDQDRAVGVGQKYLEIKKEAPAHIV
jgi:hemerythrin-like domain-containing protein